MRGCRLGGGGRLGMLKRFALGMGGKSGVPLVWLLYDEFTTPDAAPITSPRTCEPGPGTLTFTDPSGDYFISGGVLTITNKTGSEISGATGQQVGSISGLSVHAKYAVHDGSGLYFGVRGDNTVNNPAVGFYNIAGSVCNLVTPSSINPFTLPTSSGNSYQFLVITRSVGTFFIVDGKLLWSSNEDNSNDTYPVWFVYHNIQNIALDDFYALSLPANGYSEWDADFSTVTDTKTNPATSSPFNHTANCHLTTTHTAEAGNSSSYYLRYVGGSDYGLIVQALGTTGVFGGYERDSVGGLNSLFQNAGKISDGVEYQIDIVVEGSACSIFLNNVLEWSGALQYDFTVATGRVDHNLATNDIVLTTHPNPALGIATDRVIAPQTTDTFTHTDDFLAYIRNVTLPAAGSTEYFFRITGSDEITLQLVSDGSLVLLDNATSRITAVGGTITNGKDVALICEGANAEIFVDETSAGSSAVIAVTTGTAGKRLDAQDGVCDSIEIHPHDVSDLLPKALV